STARRRSSSEADFSGGLVNISSSTENALSRAAPTGCSRWAARLSAFSVLLEMLTKPPLKSASDEERLRAVDEGGIMGALNW
ncbi:hypothetical protein C6A85_13020, partial [Mycobacterium sp. ITM-2017-0098]